MFSRKQINLHSWNHLMKQVINVAGRVGRQEFAWVEHVPGGMNGLVRVPDGRTKSGWRDDIKDFELKPAPAVAPLSKKKVEPFNQLPTKDMVLQVGMVLVPSPIGDKPAILSVFALAG